MSDKYVLIGATTEEWTLYWTEMVERIGSLGITTHIQYTANLSEAKIYDTIEDAMADLPATKAGPFTNAEFEPHMVDEKEIFEARLKGE